MSRLSTSPLRKKTPIKLPAPHRKHCKARRDTKHFTPEERELIYDLKAAYRSLPGKQWLRHHQYIDEHVNPRLHDYWKEKGLNDCIVDPHGLFEHWDTERLSDKIIRCLKLVKHYVWANWHSVIASAPLKPPSLRIMKSNYIYNTERKTVLKEIREMLEEDTELTTGLVLKHRHQAVQNILSRMNDEEMEDLEDKIEEAKINGYTPEVKELDRIYFKRCNQQMHQAAHLQYIKMGTLSIQISAFVDKENDIHIQFHDYVHEFLGIKTKSFEEAFTKELTDLAKMFEGYIKTLYVMKRRSVVNQGDQSTTRNGADVASADIPSTVPEPATTVESPKISNMVATQRTETDEECLSRYKLAVSQLQDGTLDGTIKLTEWGYPILPSPWPANLNKSLQNKYYAKFMKIHYDLACGGRGDQTPVPWKGLNQNAEHFFHESYVTKELVGKLKDAQNTGQPIINAFFTHVTQHQDTFGPEHSFRFLNTYTKSSVTKSNPSGAMPARYRGPPIAAVKVLPIDKGSSAAGTVNPSLADIAPTSSVPHRNRGIIIIQEPNSSAASFINDADSPVSIPICPLPPSVTHNISSKTSYSTSSRVVPDVRQQPDRVERVKSLSVATEDKAEVGSPDDSDVGQCSGELEFDVSDNIRTEKTPQAVDAPSKDKRKTQVPKKGESAVPSPNTAGRTPLKIVASQIPLTPTNTPTQAKDRLGGQDSLPALVPQQHCTIKTLSKLPVIIS